HFFIGHQDWATDINKNWYAMNNRVAGGGFRYIPWDQENILWEPNMNRVNVSTPPSGLHTKLKGNTQYQLDFADRVHRHLVAPDGALQPGKNIERWKARLREIDSATVAESARWGDYRRDVHRRSSPYVLFSWHEHFANENARMLGSYFPVRSENVLAQLRSADLYPDVAAPLYRRGGTGGEVLGSSHLAPGTQIAMTRSGTGTILYTTDGTDPRVYYAGTTSASAQTYSTPVTVHSSVTIKSRVLSGGEWSALNEAVFTVGTMASPVRITEIMYAPPGGGEYEFLELQNVTTQAVDVSGWYLGGIDFLLPLGTVLAPGRRIVLASNDDPAAWAARYPGVSVFGYFGGSLNNSGERISLRNRGGRTMTSANYGVTAPWPVQANGGGYSLEIIDPMGDPDSPWNWHAVTIRGTAGLGNTAPAAAAVVISEVLAKNGGAVTNGGTNPDYVELHNPGAAEVDLAGWQLVTKNTMTIPAGTTIPAGGYLVIWCDSEFAAPGLHTGGASLAMEEGDVALFPPGANTPADAVRYGAQVEDLAIGRVAGAWKLIAPSPGAANVAVQLAPPASLRLNEWLASTGAGTDDFVELFNTHATLPVALEGVQIQTSTELHRIEALAFVGPRGFVAFKADESPGADHLNFKLPASGSTLTLRDPDSTVIETITFGEQALMIAEGRILDGESTITGGLTPSPGAANILPPAPTIAEHPTDKSASVGGSASFAVSANGSAPLTYQWRLDGIDLPGKTQPTLALSGITAAEAGVYTCLVKNTAGQAESNPARLTVTETFEAWRSAHFTAGELEDPLMSGLAADPDGDGLSNLQEFFHGLDPRAGNGGSLDGILPEITIEDGPPRLVTLSFRRSKTVSASAAELEASLLLDDEDWTIVPSGEITEEAAVEPISGDLLIRWKLPLAPGEPRKFLRLRITP
ncbi:MAG: lamin tail domain-containing protein, partial [Chthoniobacteraceae bacterium]